MASYEDMMRNNPLLAQGMKALEEKKSPYQNTAGSASHLGWAENIGKGQSAVDLLNNAEVLADLRTFYKERDGFDTGSDEELVEKFYSDRTWRNVNTIAMGVDVKDAYSMSEDQSILLAKIQKLYDALPNFYEKGGRGLAGLGQNLLAGIADPMNLVGFGAGGQVAKQAMRQGARQLMEKAGTTTLTKDMRAKVVRNAVKEGFKAGAKTQALEEAAIGGVQDAILQTRNKELGLQDEYYQTQMLGSAAMGGAMGGAFGGLFGAGGALYGGKVSSAARKARRDMFGDITSKYTAPESNVDPQGVAETVDTDAANAQVSREDKDDAKVAKYISAQREQYKRNLDATIDEIRTQSGEKALAEWRAGKIAPKDLTPTMKQADDLQTGRTALEELYKWPTMKASLERQLEALARTENQKPDVLNRINELSDKISRGDDAYEAIVRASGDGIDEAFDKAIADFVSFTRNPDALVMDMETGQQFGGQPQQPAVAPAPKADGEAVFARALADDAAISNADQASIGNEINKLEVAKEGGQEIDPTYEQTLKSRYKELSGQDYVRAVETAEPVADVSDTNAVEIPETAADAAEALGDVSKRYKAINNQIARLRKAIDAGNGTPASQERLTKLTAERDGLNAQSKQLKERIEALSAQEEAIEEAPVLRTADAEAAESPLDAEGVASFLSKYGFPLEGIKNELGAYLRDKKPNTREARTNAVRKYVTEKINYARSLATLGSVMEKYGPSVAFTPDAMRVLLADAPADMADAVQARYNEWLDHNAPNFFAQQMAESPSLPIDDVLSLVADKHGQSMVEVILRSLSEERDDIVQYMSVKKPQPQGWDKLTKNQQQGIEKKIEQAKARMKAYKGLTISDKKLEGMLELQKQNMVLEALYADFEKSVRTSAGKLGDNYSIVVDPESKASVSGKVWQYGRYTKDENGNVNGFEKQATVAKSDHYGLQSMLKRATGGRATFIDEHGNLGIEYSFFGSLLIRDIVRGPDDSIDFARTVDGKYVTKELPDGRTVYVPRRYSAAESARREMERNTIDRANNRASLDSNKTEANAAELEKIDADIEKKTKKVAELEASLSGIGGMDAEAFAQRVIDQAKDVEATVKSLEKEKTEKGAAFTKDKELTAAKGSLSNLQPLVPEAKKNLSFSSPRIRQIKSAQQEIENLNARKDQLSKSTNKEKAGAAVEASRKSDKRDRMNKTATGADRDEAAEALNKKLRQSVRKVVIQDAVRNAVETSPATPQRALAQNIADAEAHLGEEIPLAEVEKAWGVAEAEERMISVEAVRRQRSNDALESYYIHKDPHQLAADLQKIDAELSVEKTKPKASVDKPAGAKSAPSVYVYRGYEVDTKNQFGYEKTSDNTMAITFLGDKVGDMKVGKDGTATLMYTDADGLEASVKASSLDQMAGHLPRIFGDKVMKAGADGKISKSFDEISDSVYPIDWKASNTWGKQKRKVPVETPVETPAKLVGPVDDWKANLDVSAINLDIPEGHVLAVHILEGDFAGVTRVESLKASTPQTVGQMLGNQKTKGYTVGYVPEGTSSASRNATRLFKPLDGNDTVVRAGSPDAGSVRGSTPTIEPDELGRIKLDGLAKVSVDQGDLPIQFRDKGLTTLAKVHDLITALENVPWTAIQTKAQYATFVKDIADLYEVRAKYAPKGIQYPTASRIQAMSQWNRALSQYDGTTISTGIDLLRRLSYMDRDLPIIQSKDMDGQAGGYVLPTAGSDDANRIFLNPSAFNPDGKGSIIPQPVALLHEIGHWAYMNVLSDADRLQFWQSLGKYFDGNEIDMYTIQQRLPGIATEAEQMSPAEFFANQFTQWSITQGKVNNIPLWTKMARAIVQIAEAFGVRLRGDRASINENLVDLDPDFVELFAKILPETDPMYNRYVGLHKTLEDIRKLKNDTNARTASLAAKVLIDFDDMRRKLDDAINTSNPMDLENALDEVSREIYGKVGGKAGAKYHAVKKGDPNSGKARLRLFDGNVAGKRFGQTVRARKAMMKAHYEWREFQKELHSDKRAEAVGKYREMSTEDIRGDSASGDLNSSFEEMANLAYSTMDDDLLSALNFHANNLINAIAVGQDEARRIISHTGKMEGQSIRVFKDGTFETTSESGYQKVQRSKAARRAANQKQAEESALASVMDDIEKGVPAVNDRDAYPATSTEEALSLTPVGDMSNDALTREYKSLAGVKNARKKDLEGELKARVSTLPEVEVYPPRPELEDIPIRALERDMFQAIKRGKFDDMREIANAIAWKKRNDLGSGIATATSPKVRKAVRIIQENNSLGTSDNGVPINAPAQVRETIKNVTHRTRTDEASSRMVAHRLIAILGKGGSLDGDDSFVSRADLARIMGQGDIGDTTPVSETDEVFNAFRSEMREIGKDVRSTAGQLRAVQSISRMAVNALIDADELSKLGTNAEEITAAFVASMSGKGSIDDIFDGLPESSRSRIFDLFKENMEATVKVMRGLMSADAKKQMQPMTFFGDMLRDIGENRVYRNAAGTTGFRGMHPAIAEGFRTEFIKNTKPKRRASIENFSTRPLEESIMFFDGNGTVSFDILEARGVLAAPKVDGDFGSAVYLKKSANEDVDFPTPELQEMSDDIKRIHSRLSREMANMEAMRNAGEDVADFRATVLDPLMARLERTMGTEAGLWRMMRASDKIEGQQKVIPFVARAKNTFDFSEGSEFTFGAQSPTSLDWVLSSLENSGAINPTDANALRASVNTFTGGEAYRSLAKAIEKNAESDYLTAANTLNRTLSDLGFDSIDTGDGIVVLDDGLVRHIDDPQFAMDDYNQDIYSGERISVAGHYLEAMMNGGDPTDTTGLTTAMQAMHIPAVVTEPFKRLKQGKSITVSDIEKVNTFTKVFGENSRRIRKSGAHWLADKMKPVNGVGFYEKLDSNAAKSLMVSRDSKGRPQSVLTKMRQLPDAKNIGQRWMDRNKFWGEVPQPKSHEAILMAMRMAQAGDESFLQALPRELREVANDLAKYFRQELIGARNDGLPIGYKRNYIPQPWASDRIKEDPNGFVKEFTEYFLSEMRKGEIPTPTKDPRLVAEEKAIKLMRTLTDEGSDGVILPDNALRSRLEDPFFERVINLDPTQVPSLSRFMVNDLEGIVVRYADQVTRRRTLAREFGVGNHAVSTYMNILVNGKAAVVDALRNTKTHVQERRAADATMDVRVSETQTLVEGLPFSEEEVADFVDEAISILGNTKDQWVKNKERVRNYLLNLYEPEDVANSPELLKRVDAIVNALSEFGGMPSGIDPVEIEAMARSVAAATKVPFDRPNASMIKFSRRARTFNNITLLAFTTLASIPDLGMPLIRSGNMKAAYNGWKKYLDKDPHYREMARNIGVGLESVLHERMAHMYNDTSSRTSNAFFNLTLLNNWTNMQREAAALIGFESFKAEAKRAQDLLSRGMGESRQYAIAYRYLQRYGLEKYALKGAKAMSDEMMISDDAVRYAAMRFTNESIFAPNPNDVPLWAQGPVGAMVFQLKSYPLMMGRLSKYVLDEAMQGNPKHLMMLLASAGALGSTSLAVRDAVQQRGDTDGDGKADQLFRDRYASDSALTGAFIRWYNSVATDMGLDVQAHGTADAVLGWLTEAFMVAGGFGLFADLLHSAVENADSQAYGQLRMAGVLAGPTFSAGMDALDVGMTGIQQIVSEDPSNSDQRDAVRKMVGRVPVLGGMKAVRETVVDTLAGEAEGGGKEGKGGNKILF